MIVLQILSFLLLIPFSLVVLIAFNVYVKHWSYYLAFIAFVAVYAALWGLVFYHISFAIVVFVLFSLTHFLRMRTLRYRLSKNHSENKRIVQADIESIEPKFSLKLAFPLSLLNFVNWFPKKLRTEINQQLTLETDIDDVVNVLLESSLGTHLEINCKQTKIFFIIK